jgi:hypothetical protein
VELSNMAGGAGVVHGFDTTLAAGDAIAIGPGLAIDPMGRTLLMPVDTQVSIPDLIEASRQKVAAGRIAALPKTSLPAASLQLAAGAKLAADVEVALGSGLPTAATGMPSAAFEDCAEVAETPPSEIARATDLYLLTIAYAEGLCGHEDVYGRLCDDACVTSTDRPFRVEGIVVRVRPLVLQSSFPASTAVALDRRHLRSRVATAYFADDALLVASLISRAGLATDTWCLGARLDGGSVVPLGIIARSGTSTVFFDAWTARRERIEPPSRRYWARRMAMRPWETYLAQILQFQCQLHDLLLDGGEPGGDDEPCRTQQDVLVDAAKFLDEIGSSYAALLAQTIQPAAQPVMVKAADLKVTDLPDGGIARIADLRKRLGVALAGAFNTPRDRVLIQGGIVELPPAGYLPVVPGSTVTVNEQVRRLVGEGLDLRYCVVRPDFVPHALEEAQHMERISLLQGLDQPTDRPRVDVLVPDGPIVRTASEAAGHGFETQVDLILGATDMTGTAGGPAPMLTTTGGASAVTIRGAGRGELLRSGGVTFALAGATEAATSARMPDLLRALARQPVGNKTATAVLEEIATASHEPLEEGQLGPVFANRLRDLAVRATDHMATARLATPLFAAGGAAPATTPAFVAPLAAGETRTVELWAAMSSDGDLSALATGRTSRIHFELLLYTPSAKPSSTRIDLDGTVLVTSVQATAGGSIAIGVFNGTGRTRGVWNGGAPTDTTSQIDKEPVRIEISAVAGQPAAVTLFVGDGADQVIQVSWTLAPLTFKVVGPLISRESQTPLFRGVATERPDVLDPASDLHARALQAIDIIAAGIDDPNFATAAKNTLFPPTGTSTSDLIVRATRDWVLFHRRRDITCDEETVRPPVAPARRYAVFGRVVDDLAEIDKIREILAKGDSASIARLGFELVDYAEFAAGRADVDTPAEAIWGDWSGWLAKHPANTVEYAAILSQPPGDGQPLSSERLSRTVDVLSKVISVDPSLQTDTLTSVPASLAVAATNGSILVVALKIATTCMRVERIDPKEFSHDFKVAVADGLAAMTVGPSSGDTPVGEATFDVDKADITSDAAALKAAWLKVGNQTPNWAVVVTAKSAPVDPLLEARARAVAGVVGDPKMDIQFITVDELPKEACPAVIFLVADPPVQVPVETECYRLFRVNSPDVVMKIEQMTSNVEVLKFLDLTKSPDLGQIHFVKGDSQIELDQATSDAVDRWKQSGNPVNRYTLVFSRAGDDAAGKQDDRQKRVEQLWGLLGVGVSDIRWKEIEQPIPDCPVLVVIYAPQ